MLLCFFPKLLQLEINKIINNGNLINKRPMQVLSSLKNKQSSLEIIFQWNKIIGVFCQIKFNHSSSKMVKISSKLNSIHTLLSSFKMRLMI